MNCRKEFGVLLLIVATFSTVVGSSTRAAESCAGIWSLQGKQPHVGDSYTADAISSPDRKSSLAISEAAVEFIAGSEVGVKLDVPVNTALMEIVWANDSQAFAINVSDGTNAGPWRTYAFKVAANRAATEPIVLDPEVANASAALSRCDAKAPLNLAVVAWLQESGELLVVAEAPIVESCMRKQSDMMGFRIAKETGKILERLSRKTLLERWPNDIRCRIAD